MSDYHKKLADAPYHPGYEDAVVTPTPKYTGMNPDKMLWKPKPLSDEEIKEIATNHIHMTLGGERFGYLEFARTIEERHGIK